MVFYSQFPQSGTTMPSCIWVGGGSLNFPLKNLFGSGHNFYYGHIYKTANSHDTYSMKDVWDLCNTTPENGATPK